MDARSQDGTDGAASRERWRAVDRARGGTRALAACVVGATLALAVVVGGRMGGGGARAERAREVSRTDGRRGGARDATARWAALNVPDRCARSAFTPTAVIPGLELHELDGERAFYLSTEATTTKRERTSAEIDEEEAVKEELKEAKAEMREAETALEDEIETEKEELAIMEGKEKLPNVGRRRALLSDDDDDDDESDDDDDDDDDVEKSSKPANEDETPTSTVIKKDGKYVRRYRFQNPLLVPGGSKEDDPSSLSTEMRLMYHAANITGYDARCQFKTMQCADMATDLLARALRTNAEAVVNPKASADLLKQLSNVLIRYSTDPRTKYNASDLPSLGGAPQAMGTCAWTTEAEYNPTTGVRYDSSVSRFARAIDAHDTAVYCDAKGKRKFCKFTKLTDGPENAVTVDLDEQAYEDARRVGRLIHDLLSADMELGSSVVGWGYRGEPSPAFVSLLMLLRSNRCSRVDVYGQPGVPIDWYHNARGYAHMVAVPGSSQIDRDLSRTLLQEKFFHRVLMHYGKMCFFK